MRTTLAELPLRAWFVFHPQANVFWDDVPAQYRLPDEVGEVARSSLLDLPLLRVCKAADGGCGAHIGARCTTADGKITRPHKCRRRTP